MSQRFGAGDCQHGDSQAHDRPAGVTRRRTLQLGAAAAGSLVALYATASPADADPLQSGGRQERSFDAGWRFNRGDVTGAQAPSFDDSSWRQLDLPHDWSIEDLPGPTSTDGSLTDYPSLLVTENGGPPPGYTPPAAPTQIGPFSQAEGTGATIFGFTQINVPFVVKATLPPGPVIRAGQAVPASSRYRLLLVRPFVRRGSRSAR